VLIVVRRSWEISHLGCIVGHLLAYFILVHGIMEDVLAFDGPNEVD
jgi:hypothetical protein